MKKFSLVLYRISLLFGICWGAHAWFTWWCDSEIAYTYLVLVLLVVISALYKSTAKIRLSYSSNVIIALGCFIIGYLFRNHFALLGTTRALLAVYPIWVLLSDDRSVIQGHLNFIVKTMSFLLLLGLVEFVLLNFVSLPGYPMQYADNLNYVFFNYAFYLKNVGDYTLSTGFDRFGSFFLEPGYLAVFLVFLLYAQRFDFAKRDNRILLYSVLLSFSLAGYIMLLLGYLFNKNVYKSMNRMATRVLTLSLILFVSYFFAINYNEGDNDINNQIVQRLQFDNEKGISGNNRSSELTHYYFEQGFENGDIILGLGQERVMRINGGMHNQFSQEIIAGTGLVYYFIVFGVVSAFFYFLFYFFLAEEGNNKRYSMFFLLLVVVCFIQAAYPESLSWIYPFIIGIKSYKDEGKRRLSIRKNAIVINK